MMDKCCKGRQFGSLEHFLNIVSTSYDELLCVISVTVFEKSRKRKTIELTTNNGTV